MTPKEKAQELVDKFMDIKNIKLSDYSVIYLPAAKQCALIAVDEMVKEFGPSYYWQEVKEEIQNL